MKILNLWQLFSFQIIVLCIILYCRDCRCKFCSSALILCFFFTLITAFFLAPTSNKVWKSWELKFTYIHLIGRQCRDWWLLWLHGNSRVRLEPFSHLRSILRASKKCLWLQALTHFHRMWSCNGPSIPHVQWDWHLQRVRTQVQHRWISTVVVVV